MTNRKGKGRGKGNWEQKGSGGALFDGGGATALPGGVGKAGGEEDGEDEGVGEGGAVAGFDEPPEVDDGGDGGEVDEAVEERPAFAADGAEDELRGGGGEQE